MSRKVRQASLLLSKWPLSAVISHFQTHYEKYKIWNWKAENYVKKAVTV
jgi:hypothetical protein